MNDRARPTIQPPSTLAAVVRWRGYFSGIAWAVLAASIDGGAALGQCQYQVTVLPEIECGFLSGPPAPMAMNNLGHVVGFMNCGPGERAVLWTGGAQWVTLPLPPGFDESRPYAINDLDEIVGEAVDTVPIGGGGTSSTTYACLWRPGQPPQLLGIPPGANYSIATGINSHSEICGYWNNAATGPLRSFIWRDGVMTTIDVPFLEGPMAQDINDRSEIAGWGFNGTVYAAFLWANDVAHELPMVPGAYMGRAFAITEDSRVVGLSRFPVAGTKYSTYSTTIWTLNSAAMVPALPGFTNCLAWDANTFAVVGECDNGPIPGNGAFLYQDGTVHDLQALTPNSIVRITYAINTQGTILAGGRGSRFVLTPMVVMPADVTRNCVVDIDDLLAVISEWGPGSSFADIDGDGLVALSDLLLVIEQWRF